MTAEEVTQGAMIVALCGSPVLATAVGVLVARRRDNFKALTDMLVKRVGDLEARVDTVESKLDAEQAAHDHTRTLLVRSEAALAAARAFIRSMMRWATGDRGEPMPVPTGEVLGE
ncbi:hypothetical protein SEA_RANDO14_33 [Mycobacterium phage Rando14]|uniref:Uncharacterized protein n=1 Tax=Mycobacterium phage Rando14 TaxID=2301556 RepID=A0A385D3T8_9CAUD|nr:hypothetical protein I5G75_gp63 [Mycobacterium phage Rando14]AXQ53053.1 hypothetical protein SEA_RANDO14_33 [Mycobacterium phage Rando14]